VQNTGKGKPLLLQGDILLMHATPKDSALLKTYLESLDGIAEQGIMPALFNFQANQVVA
jgi:hypothetical protein